MRCWLLPYGIGAWRQLGTNSSLESLCRRSGEAASGGRISRCHAALMLIAVRLRHIAVTEGGTKRYLQMKTLAEVAAIA